jgi:tetratricopeptide (TPR) repeat protein
LGRYEEAIAAFDQALAIKPDDQDALNNKGNALGNLERYEEAIAAFDQALAIKPDYHNAFYNKACCYGLQKDVVKAVEFLQQAIGLNPKYREDAKTDSDFDGVRDDERFRAVVDTVST